MTTRSERDKCKGLQEKHQAILSQLLKEEDNKYCVDCDAKGPRWGSWNLGVFLCIRCAGIHRNLGVHISKVKSVNLDTWTPEQLAMVQEMGNSRARAVYEANLPDHFRRPQTDSTLEAFIRAKYEQKKYIAKEWVPPQPKIQQVPAVVDEKKEKKKARPRPTSAATNIQLSGPKPNSKPVTASATPVSMALTKAVPPAKKQDSNIDDLIGLESSVTAPTPTNNDIFSDFISASMDSAMDTKSSTTTKASTGSDGLEASLFESSSVSSGEPPKSTKDSIMALFGSAPQQPQPQNFGVSGGMYINQQGGQQQMPNMQNVQQMPNMQMAATIPGTMPVSMSGAMPNGMPNGMMAGGNMMGTNVGMMGVPAGNSMMAPGIQTNPMPQNNLMVVDPMDQLRTSLVHNMVYSGFPQGQMMMGPMGAMPAMQTGQMMPGQGMSGQIAAPAYNVAAQGLFNMPPQQPVAVANQQFQQLANQMAGMPMGVQTVGGFPAGGGIAAGGGGMWGAPQPGQTLSTNLWQ